ncbi:MAG: M23 family metallopeptidase [Vicinamibacterales bacterium]
MDPSTARVLAPRLGVTVATVEAFFSASGVVADQSGPCLPYVLVTGGAEGVASLHLPASSWQAPETDSRPVSFCETSRRVIEGSASQLQQGLAGPFLDIPPRVHWQLDVLAHDMLAAQAMVLPDDGESGEGPVAGSAVGDLVVRVVLDRRGAADTERLQSVELIEPATRRRLDGAWWVERADGSGVLFGMSGSDYDRLLWLSSVHADRLSRGVGPAARIVQRTVTQGKGTRATRRVVTRVVKPRGYHLGIDLMAPRGTEVHAVADARVAVAGTSRGFGKLVVLDHGHGYRTYYAHLTAIAKGLSVGDVILRGDVLGLVGSTGRSTGPHLHFETRRGNDYIDPIDTTRQLEFWVLTAEAQQWIAQQMLSYALPIDDDVPTMFRGVSLVVPADATGAVRTEPWVSQPGACRAYTQTVAPERPELPKPVVRKKAVRKPRPKAPTPQTSRPSDRVRGAARSMAGRR